jgi:MazG family protein
MARLLLVDTADALPGLLPLHSWSALMSSDLVVTADAEHPFVAHLDAAELRHEVVPEDAGSGPLGRSDLLGGLSPEDKGRARWVVERARSQGDVAYLFGAGDSDAFTRTLGMEAARAGVEVEVVYFGVAPKGLALLELVAVEERLRGPGGCPWDREQDHGSLAPYAVEEVFELLEAIAAGETGDIREELGDVLLQVVFHAQIAADAGTFDIDDVARAIAGKLVRRHPHVFASEEVADADEVKVRWDELKAEEKPEREGPFDGVAAAQPSLPYVAKLQSRAARLGFEWPAAGPDGTDPAAERVREELDEVLQADSDEARAAEIGDLLLSVAGLARRHGVDAEMALRGAAQRFRARFERAVGFADRPPRELSADDWLRLWERAKG